jgi:hypothetical protein
MPTRPTTCHLSHRDVATPTPPLPQAQARIRDLSARAEHARRETARLRRGIRDELITLVNTHVVTRWFANDALARLGLPPLPGAYLVGLCLPVTVTVDAPNGAVASHAACAQVVNEAARLRHARLRRAAPARTPPAHPVRDSVSVFSVTRLRCRGAGGMPRYTVTGLLRLAVTVYATDKATAWDTAQHALRADLARLRPVFVTFYPDRASRSWVRAAGTPALAAGID